MQLWTGLPGAVLGLALTGAALWGQPAKAAQDEAAGKVCVRNGADRAMFFAAEARGGVRAARWLEPGEQMCSAAVNPAKGVVSVFPDEDVQEGCSRLASPGLPETLLEYHDIDRCLWESLKP